MPLHFSSSGTSKGAATLCNFPQQLAIFFGGVKADSQNQDGGHTN